MLKLVGDVPEAWLTSSQLPPVLVVPMTLKAIGVPSVLATATFWNPVLVAPAGAEKVAPPGVTKKSAVLLTTSVTGIVWGEPLPVVGVTVIVPV
jgi:hypothetical protein